MTALCAVTSRVRGACHLLLPLSRQGASAPPAPLAPCETPKTIVDRKISHFRTSRTHDLCSALNTVHCMGLCVCVLGYLKMESHPIIPRNTNLHKAMGRMQLWFFSQIIGDWGWCSNTSNLSSFPVFNVNIYWVGTTTPSFLHETSSNWHSSEDWGQIVGLWGTSTAVSMVCVAVRILWHSRFNTLIELRE